MANPYRGEVTVGIGGEAHVMRLSLAALVDLEVDLGDGSLVELVERFEAGRFSARDVVRLLAAGLGRSVADVAEMPFDGGPIGAARAAARLLAVTFALPEATEGT